MFVVIGNESPRPEITPQGVGCIAEDEESAFKEAGHRTLMAYPEPKNGNKCSNNGDLLLPSVRVPGFTMALPRRLILKTFTELLVDFSEDRPDLIILNSPHQVAGTLALIARILKIPYFLWVHTDLKKYAETKAPWGTSDIATRMVHGLAKKIADGAALTIFPSKDARDKFVKRTEFSGKTFILPGCVDPTALMSQDDRDDFSMTFRTREGLPWDSSRYPILHITGRVGPEKNIAFAIEAFAELACLCRDPYRRNEYAIPGITSPVLVLVGDGTKSYIRKMRNLAKSLGVSDLVYFVGKKSRKEVRQINQISCGFLFPSDGDTEGLALLEAAIDGCLVTYKKGEAPEEFLGTSSALPAHSFDWAFRLHDLLSDKAARQKVADICQKAAAKYTDKSHFSAQLRCLLWLHT